MSTSSIKKLREGFDWQFAYPSGFGATLIKGDQAYNFAKAMNDKSEKDLGGQAVLKVWYDKNTKSLPDSNFLQTVLADQIAREKYGIKVINSFDERYSSIVKEVLSENNLTTKFPELIINDISKPKEEEPAIREDLINLVEEKEGDVKFPFKVYGLSLSYDSNISDGCIRVVPSKNNLENMTIVHSDKFSKKHNNKRFNEVDKFGNPIFDEEGKREWYISPDLRLTNLRIDENSNLLSLGNLFHNYGDHRIILVGSESELHNQDPHIK